MSNIPNQFEATDPRNRAVICTEDTWTGHIIKFHPELDGNVQLVIDAIERPDFGFIYRDANYENRDIYYRRPQGQHLYVKVIVEFDAELDGEVITAFRTDVPKAKEKLIWPD